MYPYMYLAVLLPMVHSQLSNAAVVNVSPDEGYRRSLEGAISEIKKLQEELQEMKDWKLVISKKLEVLRDLNTNEQDVEQRTRRGVPPQEADCTPGTSGCLVQDTGYVVPFGACILCPPGSSGAPGPAGPPGRDGRDATACSSQDNTVPVNPSNNSGTVYVRWGHHECPSTSQLIYTGTGASSNHRKSGGGADQLCLPGNPVYDSPIAGVGSSRAFVYTMEYQTPELATKLWHDIPCAVCKAPSRYSKLMMPGMSECPSSDWTREYGGYLMAERTHDGHHRSLHICVDREMQNVYRTGGHASDNNMALMNFVEARCSSSGGGIPCGPYVDGYELTCAVCTQ